MRYILILFGALACFAQNQPAKSLEQRVADLEKQVRELKVALSPNHADAWERTKECSAEVEKKLPLDSNMQQKGQTVISHYNRKLERCLASYSISFSSPTILVDVFEGSPLAMSGSSSTPNGCFLLGEKADCDKVNQFIRDAMSQ